VTTPPFFDFLDEKPLYYKTFDPERIRRAYDRIRERIAHPPVIHIVGTNGKGSTGRMIAHLARASGTEDGRWRMEDEGGACSHSTFNTQHSKLSVGHYSSPHILRFNERIWIDGEEISDGALEEGHRRLYALLGAECAGELSYFEYTTLLALLLFESCDLVVLEAGLGGEYDATGVAENRILTVVTPIGMDHREFLGESVEAIAATKLRSVPEGGRALLAPQPHPEVYRVAEEILAERKARLYRMDDISLNAQPSTLDTLFEEKPWPPFLRENARTALRALDLAGISADPEALRSLELFGRYYPLRENIRLDVGHNPLAARALAEVLEPGTVLIYNALADKEYAEVLSILAPKLKRVELIPIETERAAPMEALQRVLEELELPWSCFDGQLFSHERYLVFGSFYTVEAFLRAFLGSTDGV
jgi:dihydrofolate synthase/folylpolyglutamate synthase